MTIRDLSYAGLEAALNGYLGLDPVTRERVAALHGRTIGVEVLGLGLTLYFTPDETGALLVHGRHEGEPDCWLRGTPLDLVRAGDRAKGADQLFSQRVRIEGDSALAQRFGAILADIDVDWEEQLSRVVGDVAAHEVGRLKRVIRQSPTLGKKPPAGAVVLFDGTKDSLKNWEGGRMTEDGLLMEGTTSKQTFGDHSIHFEFRLAYQPEDRGQGRSNSGIYLQGRYEVQILDSFGLEGKDNECGGLYSVKAPSLNMCYPPLSWQTYDIDFKAARFDDQGKLLANPRVTVRHNGVVVHNDVELPGERSTTAAPVGPGSESGPVFLQNHGCPLRYRNVWVAE